MAKIKAINQQYSTKEITAIVDTLYPFREYELDSRGIPDANPDYCDKEDLINLFLTLNKCNRKLSFSPIPLTAREKKKLMEERAETYKQLQEKINPKPIEEKAPLMQVTSEAINGLKPYFKAAFKGVGNGNPDRFNEYLIPALKSCLTKKEIAALALYCFNSPYFNKKTSTGKELSWNKWAEVVCNLFSIDRLPYKPGELPPPDYDVKYQWLQPPKNRQ